MKKIAFAIVCLCLFWTLLFAPSYVVANTLSLGTSGNAANWLVTGAGATGSPSFQVTTDRAGEIKLYQQRWIDRYVCFRRNLGKFSTVSGTLTNTSRCRPTLPT